MCFVIHQQYGVGKRPVLASLRTLSGHNVTSPSLAAQYMQWIRNGFEMDLKWICNGFEVVERPTDAPMSPDKKSVEVFIYMIGFLVMPYCSHHHNHNHHHLQQHQL